MDESFSKIRGDNMKIKGWRKTGDESWDSIRVRGQWLSIEIDLGNWVFAVYGLPLGVAGRFFNQGIAFQSKRFTNKEQAIEEAIKWMQAHPNGIRGSW